MATDSLRPAIHEVKPADRVEIPAEVTDAMAALPDRNAGRQMTFPPWVDEVLRTYWGVKRQSDIAKIVGVSIGVLRRRAEELHL